MGLDIVGAGMAGLLAANMLYKHNPIVIEAQKQLPNNHAAVLRFRSSQVGDVLGIQFKKVKMIKTALPWRNPVADAMAYSFKNGGIYRSDRSIISGLTVDDRYIAPPDLIEQMYKGVSDKVKFGLKYDGWQRTLGGTHCISTIPMPALMKILDYPHKNAVEFSGVPGWVIRAKVMRCDTYVSLMVPDPTKEFSRISITGDEIIVELPNWANEVKTAEPWMDSVAKKLLWEACSLLGIEQAELRDVYVHRQQYAKINPIDDDIRRDFIHWATDGFGIFSLGRFATWRPGLLLDDLVKDIRLIDKWIKKGIDRYAIAKHR